MYKEIVKTNMNILNDAMVTQMDMTRNIMDRFFPKADLPNTSNYKIGDCPEQDKFILIIEGD